LSANPHLAVIIPCYRVKRHISDVIGKIGPYIKTIYVIDDCCPEQTGRFVHEHLTDPRIRVLYHEINQGVGAATLTGMRTAVADGADILIKIDGDDQMDTSLIPRFTQPIVEGLADYTKGNRFFFLNDLHAMPPARIFGNAALSFMSKISSGYWNLFDPTNGFLAIHSGVLNILPHDRIARRYFFESDLLHHLYLAEAVVLDIPIKARYGDEESNLKISKVIPQFLGKHITNFLRRLGLKYFLRDFSIGTVYLLSGTAFFGFGLSFGTYSWIHNALSGAASTAGTVMLAALPTLIGIQFLVGFISYDIFQVPTVPLHKRLGLNFNFGSNS
jgi:glycosyltransferase involved in cell wall biosynthesis